MNQDKLSLNEQQFIIAHEIAHFIMNHKTSSQIEDDEANELVQEWKIDLK